MKTLPFDYYRCHPIIVDSWCEQCARWANHPEQIYGEMTSSKGCNGSTDEKCGYIHENRDETRVNPD